MLPANSQALDGRYLITYAHNDMEGVRDVLRQRYDVGTRETTVGDWDLSLRASLSYLDDLQTGSSSYLSTRLFGDLRKPSLRFRTQIEPWQDVGFDSTSRHQSYRFGVDVTPRNRPTLNLDYVRRDRQTLVGSSWQEDARAVVSYGRGPVNSSLSFRNVVGASESAFESSQHTQEWRGNVQGEYVQGRWVTRGAYEALYSTFASNARRRELLTHRINVDSVLRLSRQVSLIGVAHTRYGTSEDNAITNDRGIREETLSMGANYEPGFGLRLRGSREYRRQQLSLGNSISDYIRLEAMLRRSFYRELTFQSGYLKSIELKSQVQQVPRSTAYAFVDGPLRPGIAGRAELSAAFPEGSVDTGTLWRRRLELRTVPRRGTTFDVNWRRDTLPQFDGRSQIDEEWYYVLGYAATQSVSFLASWKDLDGHGRIERTEQEATFTTTLRLARRSSVGVHWSNRNTSGASFRGNERVLGAEFTTWLPREFKVQMAVNDITGNRRNAGTSYSATLTKNF